MIRLFTQAFIGDTEVAVTGDYTRGTGPDDPDTVENLTVSDLRGNVLNLTEEQADAVTDRLMSDNAERTMRR